MVTLLAIIVDGSHSGGADFPILMCLGAVLLSAYSNARSRLQDDLKHRKRRFVAGPIGAPAVNLSYFFGAGCALGKAGATGSSASTAVPGPAS